MTDTNKSLEDLAAFLTKEFDLILHELEELPVKPKDAPRVAILMLEQLCLMLPR